MIEKLKIEADARYDAKELYRVRYTTTEHEFCELAFNMMMQQFHTGVSAALDEARVILKEESIK